MFGGEATLIAGLAIMVVLGLASLLFAAGLACLVVGALRYRKNRPARKFLLAGIGLWMLLPAGYLGLSSLGRPTKHYAVTINLAEPTDLSGIPEDAAKFDEGRHIAMSGAIELTVIQPGLEATYQCREVSVTLDREEGRLALKELTFWVADSPTQADVRKLIDTEEARWQQNAGPPSYASRKAKLLQWLEDESHDRVAAGSSQWESLQLANAHATVWMSFYRPKPVVGDDRYRVLYKLHLESEMN